MAKIELLLFDEVSRAWHLSRKIEMPFVPGIGTKIRLDDTFCLNATTEVILVCYVLSTGKIMVRCETHFSQMCVEYLSGRWRVVGEFSFSEDETAQDQIAKMRNEGKN